MNSKAALKALAENGRTDLNDENADVRVWYEALSSAEQKQVVKQAKLSSSNLDKIKKTEWQKLIPVMATFDDASLSDGYNDQIKQLKKVAGELYASIMRGISPNRWRKQAREITKSWNDADWKKFIAEDKKRPFSIYKGDMKEAKSILSDPAMDSIEVPVMEILHDGPLADKLTNTLAMWMTQENISKDKAPKLVAFLKKAMRDLDKVSDSIEVPVTEILNDGDSPYEVQTNFSIVVGQFMNRHLPVINKSNTLKAYFKKILAVSKPRIGKVSDSIEVPVMEILHDGAVPRIDLMRKIVKEHQHAKIEGQIVDATSANAYVKVYEALSPASRKKFDAKKLEAAMGFVWFAIKAK